MGLAWENWEIVRGEGIIGIKRDGEGFSLEFESEGVIVVVIFKINLKNFFSPSN